MAPFLFIIAMEGLHVAITNLVKDDVMLIGEWDADNLQVIIKALRFFDCIYGLKIHLQKPSVIGIGVDYDKVTAMAKSLDLRQPNCIQRLRITRLGKHVIEAEVISGNNIGYKTYIPKMKLIPSDQRIPFRFHRRQFPLVVSFAMTINKSQGKSLTTVGLYLQPVFTHGQLYVAIFRFKSKKSLKVLICDNDGKPKNTTTIVVYKEVL
uniref:uncharacterized protein LOC122583511 n=1 Tax=Erigeron canadensis TaxID=72917 RepID=UPI001CB9C72D|nr:uncharacterized protein LOC122583511 [Erigeron canadensis]